MKNNNLYADIKNLSTDEILDCYLKAFEKLDEEDQEKIENCHEILMGIKNMGVFSAWELLSKLGIYLSKNRNFV